MKIQKLNAINQNMKLKKLTELHSIKTKFLLNFYILFIIADLFLIYKVIKDNNITLIFISVFLLILFASLYYISYLCFFDEKNKIIILKKPFLKKIKIIKLEDIIIIDTVRFPIITRQKHIKITVKEGGNDDNTYYVPKSSNFITGDDAKYLWKEVRNRKKELQENENSI